MNTDIKLTDEQRNVVLHRNSPALVVAGAGSGKTQTVTSHVITLLADGIKPENIMMLTFTRKAAEEMRERIKAYVGEDLSNKIIAGTFHSVGVRMLRHFGWEYDRVYNPGLFASNFDVLGKGESADSLDLIRTRFNRTYPTRHNCTEETLLKMHLPSSDKLEDFFSQCKNRQLSIQEGLQTLSIAKEWTHKETLTYLQELALDWADEKRMTKQMNYDDILEAWQEIATNRPETCKHIQALVIDEAQDMNNVQHDITYAIYSAMPTNHLMLVGDAAQSIYGWRGANVYAFDEFPKTYPNTKIYELSKNFRSYEPILNIANQTLDGCDIKSTTHLSSVRGYGPDVHFREFNTEKHQAKAIFKIIKTTRPDQKVAVIARSSKTFHPIEAELIRENLEYEVCGGKPLSEQTQVRDIMALLRFAYNQMNEASLCRLLKLFNDVGDKTAADILDTDIEKCLTNNQYTNKTGIRADAINYACNTLKMAQRALELTPWPETMTTAIKIYRKILIDAEDAATEKQKHKQSKQKLQERADIFKHEILEHLDEVIAPILIEISKDSTSAQSFADDFKIERPQTLSEENAKITLTTIHSAKGLEWDRVIVANCTDNDFSAKKDSCRNQKEFKNEQEEQRRCLYVAVTRARNELWCFWPRMIIGQFGKENQVSRYLEKSVYWSKS